MSRYYSVLVITVVVINGLHCTSNDLYTYLKSPSSTTDTEFFVVVRLEAMDGGNIR